MTGRSRRRPEIQLVMPARPVIRHVSVEAMLVRLLVLPAARRRDALTRACTTDPALCDRLPEIMAGLAIVEDYPQAGPRERPPAEFLVSVFQTALKAGSQTAIGSLNQK